LRYRASSPEGDRGVIAKVVQTMPPFIMTNKQPWRRQPLGAVSVIDGVVAAYMPAISPYNYADRSESLSNTHIGQTSNSAGVGALSTSTFNQDREIVLADNKKLQNLSLLWYGTGVEDASGTNSPITFGITANNTNSDPWIALGMIRVGTNIRADWNRGAYKTTGNVSSLSNGETACFVLTHRSGQVVLYKNGVQVGSSIDAATISYSATSLFGFNVHLAGTFSGCLNVLGVLFNKTLSAPEVADLSANPYQIFRVSE
jgi:hypothetical protein